MRFRSQSGAHPPQEPVVTKPIPKAGNSPGDVWNPLPVANGSRGNLLKTQEPKYGRVDTGMNLSSSPSQTFVRDTLGKPTSYSSDPPIPSPQICCATPHSSSSHLSRICIFCLAPMFFRPNAQESKMDSTMSRT